MFYFYNQNNSGGGFDLKAENVIVEANSADEANTIAQTVGVYFYGVDEDGDYIDCECCGNRWDAFENENYYGIYATLDEAIADNTHHFSYWHDYAIVVPMGSDVYRMAENPNAPRCKGTTKKGERCNNGSDCNYHKEAN